MSAISKSWTCLQHNMMGAGCPLAPLPLFEVKVMSWMGCGMCTCTKLYTYLHPSLVAMPLQAPKNHEMSLLRDGCGHVTQVNTCMANIVIQANTQNFKVACTSPFGQWGLDDMPYGT